ncbi:MAG TPA: hypothetical protein VFD51_03890 [Patescibacteria group bacterium]|nr:hypothetical protein [Patescibacteria group bacterium]
MGFFTRKTKKNNEGSKMLKNPKILEVNLIKEEAQLDFDWRRNGKALIFVLGVTIFIILEIYFGLIWWKQDEEVRLEGIRAEITAVSRQSSQMRIDAKDALAYQEKTKLVGSLLDNHIYWTNFFSWIEKNTLSTVSFNGFSGSNNGDYSLSGVAGSYAEVSWQAKQFLSAPFVRDVEISTASSQAGPSKQELEKAAAAALAGENTEDVKPELPPGVSFELVLELNTEIFNK